MFVARPATLARAMTCLPLPAPTWHIGIRAGVLAGCMRRTSRSDKLGLLWVQHIFKPTSYMKVTEHDRMSSGIVRDMTRTSP